MKRIFVLAVGVGLIGVGLWFHFTDRSRLAFGLSTFLGLLGVMLATTGPDSDVTRVVRAIGQLFNGL